jgi:hypothetical protein
MNCAKIFLGISVLLASAAAFAGGEGSGGGTVGRFPGTTQLALVDLVQRNPGLAPAQDPWTPEDGITVSRFARTLGYDHFQIQGTHAYQTVLTRLSLWEASSPIVISSIRQALAQMDWIYTAYRQQVCSSDSLPHGLPLSAFEGAVIFDATFGARLSAPVWNRMGSLSREALLIHEALRHIEIVYQSAITEDDLRAIVSQIILSAPQEGETLDRRGLFDGSLGHSIGAKFDTQAVIEESCSELKRLRDLRDLSKSSVAYVYSKYCPGGSPLKTHTHAQWMEIDQAFFDVILSVPSTDTALQRKLHNTYEVRSDIDMLLNSLTLVGLQGATTAMVDSTRHLDFYFVGISEDFVRRYLNDKARGLTSQEVQRSEQAINRLREIHRSVLKDDQFLKCN